MAGDSGIPGVLPHQLAEWWEHGEGAAKIGWGSPGSFDRCVRLAVEEAHMDPERAKGFCAERYHAATGTWPGRHSGNHAGRADMADTQRAEMTSASINDLPDSAFAYIEAGGKKDASGRTVPRSLRHFPVHDAAHVRDALDRAPQSPFGTKAMPKIRQRAKKFGVDVSDDSSSRASRAAGELLRIYPLEDIHILTRAEGDGSGRVVEAYATVFDQEAEIHDHQGHYMEVIDRTAFDDVLQRIARMPGGLAAQVKVLFNHGRTVGGVEAPEFQLPLGKPLDVRPEARGLLTRTEYDASDPFTERILSKIHAGTITAQSFVGGILRSSPELRGPGDRHRARNGALTTVRRMMLGLREYGPVLYPAYSGAEILGVRMQLPGSAGELSEDFDVPLGEEYDPGKEAVVAGSVPEDTTTARYHQHALYRMISEEKRKAVGLVW